MTTFCYSSAQEEILRIDLPDTKDLRMKAILRGSLDRPVAVLVHGRPGTADDVRMYLFARYLHEQDISSLRLFLYDDSEGSRKLLEIDDVNVHAADIHTSVDYLRKQGATRIFAIGHSYGGLSILKSNTQLNGVVLWDASHGLAWQELDKKGSKAYREYSAEMVIDKRGKGYLVSKKMSDGDRALGDTSRLTSVVNCPLFVVAAGKGRLARYGKMYYDAASQPKKFLSIPQASHLFLDSDEVTFELFEQTASWIKELVLLQNPSLP